MALDLHELRHRVLHAQSHGHEVAKAASYVQQLGGGAPPAGVAVNSPEHLLFLIDHQGAMPAQQPVQQPVAVPVPAPLPEPVPEPVPEPEPVPVPVPEPEPEPVVEEAPAEEAVTEEPAATTDGTEPAPVEGAAPTSKKGRKGK